MREVSRGGWLLERVDAQTHVAAVAGAGFEAYVRILHPVPVHRGEEATRWPWSEVAQRVGRTMHPLVQWNRLADIHDGPDFADGWEVGQTTEGFLALDPLAVLTGHLSELRSRLAGLLRQGVPVEPLVLPEPEVRAAVVDGPFLRWRGLEMILLATSVDELADERLESYEVDEDSDLGWEGDLVNPPRAGWSEGP